MSASAANAISLTTAVVTLYDPTSDLKCGYWTMYSDSANTAYALINIAGIHKPGEYIGVPPGRSWTCKSAIQDIGVITAKSASGTVIVSYGNSGRS